MKSKNQFCALAIAAAAAAPAHALTAGDLAFTAFNADEDGWSLVTLVDLAPNTVIYFTDNEWNGSAIGAGGAFNTGESYHQWSSGATTVAAGSVIRFSAIDNATSLAASVGSLARAGVSGSANYGISQDNETIYAYLGSAADAPTTFLGAISSGGFSVAQGQLANTGLAVGASALQLQTGSDFGQYTGPRAGLASFADYLPGLTNIAQWSDLGNGSYAGNLPDLTPFTVTPVPEPGSLALLAAGLGVLGLRRRVRA